MIPRKAIQAIHSAICEESLEDHMDPDWPGRCVKAAQAAYPHLIAQAKAEALEDAVEWLKIPSQPNGGFAAGWLKIRAKEYRKGNL